MSISLSEKLAQSSIRSVMFDAGLVFEGGGVHGGFLKQCVEKISLSKQNVSDSVIANRIKQHKITLNGRWGIFAALRRRIQRCFSSRENPVVIGLEAEILALETLRTKRSEASVTLGVRDRLARQPEKRVRSLSLICKNPIAAARVEKLFEDSLTSNPYVFQQ